MTNLLRLIMALATGALIGFFTVVLLPFLFIFWLTYWLPQEIDAHLSVAKPSPAVRCDGDLVKSEQAFDYTAYLPEWWRN